MKILQITKMIINIVLSELRPKKQMLILWMVGPTPSKGKNLRSKTWLDKTLSGKTQNTTAHNLR